MLSKLEPGQKLLILRYGKQIVENCIQLHRDKIEISQYCWFGKLGTIPSKKSIDAMMSEKCPKLILYARNTAYLCDVNSVSFEEPQDGYPDYYKTELFSKQIFPTVYFKLTSIEPIEIKELENFTVMSSGNAAINTLMHSMSSFLFVEYGKSKIVVAKTKGQLQTAARKKLSENDCVYRKAGRCGLRGFVNFQYECDRPSNCIRQKR